MFECMGAPYVLGDDRIAGLSPVERAGRCYDALLEDQKLFDIAPGLWKAVESMGYRTSPASTIHHCAYPGGLMVHSVNVANEAGRLVRVTFPDDDELVRQAVFCGLVHDVCKLGAYDMCDDGSIKWHEGHDPRHGDLSRRIVERYREVDDARWERMSEAIEWHMGLFDVRLAITPWMSFDEIGKAIEMRARFLSLACTPLVNALIAADYEATWFEDARDDAVMTEGRLVSA